MMVRGTILHLVLIVLVGFLVYSNTFNAPFQFDDVICIVENPYIQNTANFILGDSSDMQLHPELQRTLKSRAFGYFTFALNYRAHGLDVRSYHAVNLAIHILNAIMVYFIVMLTFRTPILEGSALKGRSGFMAFLTALLFVCHPVQTQAVTYLYQRFASLATLFYLASFLSYIRSQLSMKRAVQYTHYALALVFAILAMKTKELIVTLPFVIAVYDSMFFRKTLKKRLFSTFSLFLVMLLFSLVIIGLHGSFAETTKEIKLQTNLSRTDYLYTQFRVIVTYLRLLVLPINQNLDYDYPIYRSFFNPKVFLSFLFLLGWGALGIYLLSRSRISDQALRFIAFGIFWFFITLSVESTIIPIVDVIFEHRIYLPSTGFFIAVISFLFIIEVRLRTKIPFLGKMIIPVLICIAIVLSGATYARNLVWTDEARLWEDVIEKSPMKSRGYSNLGSIYYKRGEYDKALEHLNRSIEVDDMSLDIERTYANRGLVHFTTGKYDRALDDFNKAIFINPYFKEMYYLRGNVFLSKKMLNEARDDFQKSCNMGDSNGCSKLESLKR
jgi:hypothetical protein